MASYRLTRDNDMAISCKGWLWFSVNPYICWLLALFRIGHVAVECEFLTDVINILKTVFTGRLPGTGWMTQIKRNIDDFHGWLGKVKGNITFDCQCH